MPEPQLTHPLGLDELLSGLSESGRALGDLAASAGLGAAVPSCPNWQVRDLLRHVSGVHRWATRYVLEGLSEMIPERDLAVLSGGWPSDGSLADWYGEGLEALVLALGGAADDLECWTFFAAPNSRWFWARRQAHETTVHAIDAALATGAELEVSATFAADGLDELLTRFVPRLRRRFASPLETQLEVQTTDTGDRWLLQIGDTGPSASRIETPSRALGGDGLAMSAAEIRGGAADLYRWSWARGGRDGLTVSGDLTVVDLFEQSVHVTWS